MEPALSYIYSLPITLTLAIARRAWIHAVFMNEGLNERVNVVARRHSVVCE